jgi:hypothetical protein
MDRILTLNALAWIRFELVPGAGIEPARRFRSEGF